MASTEPTKSAVKTPADEKVTSATTDTQSSRPAATQPQSTNDSSTTAPDRPTDSKPTAGPAPSRSAGSNVDTQPDDQPAVRRLVIICTFSVMCQPGAHSATKSAFSLNR